MYPPGCPKGRGLLKFELIHRFFLITHLKKNVTYTSVHFNHLKIKHYLSLLSIKTIQNLTSIYLYECTQVLSAVGITQNVMF